MSLAHRIATLKYSGFLGLAEEHEKRKAWRKAAMMWTRAAEAGQSINDGYGEWAAARAEVCRRRISEQENGNDTIAVAS